MSQDKLVRAEMSRPTLTFWKLLHWNGLEWVTSYQRSISTPATDKEIAEEM